MHSSQRGLPPRPAQALCPACKVFEFCHTCRVIRWQDHNQSVVRKTCDVPLNKLAMTSASISLPFAEANTSAGAPPRSESQSLGTRKIECNCHARIRSFKLLTDFCERIGKGCCSIDRQRACFRCTRSAALQAGIPVAITATVAGAVVRAGDPQADNARDRTRPIRKINLIEEVFNSPS